MARDQDYRNSGFINFKYDDESKSWGIGGTYTNEKGEELDLGWVKTGGQNLTEALKLIAAQVQPSIAGKGFKKVKRENRGSNGDKGGPE
jgi:hypothetical protein